MFVNNVRLSFTLDLTSVDLIAVARSVAMPLGMQAVPRLIPASVTFFRGDLVMKIFFWPFFLFR